MKVTVVDRALQSRLWGNGYTNINQVLTTVEISDTCPCCGERRGKPHLRRFCEDDEWYDVSLWSNPCGHIDRYAAVIEEAHNLEPSEYVGRK